MTCASCQHHVEEALQATAGVESAHVDLMAHRASVVFDRRLQGRKRWSMRFAERATMRCCRERAIQKSTAKNMVVNRSGGRGDAGRRSFGDAAGDAAGAEMGAMGSRLDRSGLDRPGDDARAAVLYALPQDFLRWFLLILTAIVMGWRGAGFMRAH